MVLSLGCHIEALIAYTVDPTCFEVKSFRNINWSCIRSVNKLLCIVLTNCGNKCFSMFINISFLVIYAHMYIYIYIYIYIRSISLKRLWTKLSVLRLERLFATIRLLTSKNNRISAYMDPDARKVIHPCKYFFPPVNRLFEEANYSAPLNWTCFLLHTNNIIPAPFVYWCSKIWDRKRQQNTYIYILSLKKLLLTIWGRN